MSRSASHRRPIQVSLTLQLEREQVVPEVRAWVDLAIGGRLHCEHELQLDLLDRWSWHGEFVAREPGPFLYRVAIRAHAGAHWSLCMHDHALERCLFSDADELAVDKSHLVGSVVLPGIAPSPRWADALVLVRGRAALASGRASIKAPTAVQPAGPSRPRSRPPAAAPRR